MGARYLNPDDIVKIIEFISECTIIDITEGIKELAIHIRQNYRIKLPDCIILATSLWLNIPFITADQDFKKFEFADLIYFKR